MIIRALILILFSTTWVLNAQSPGIQWQKSLGGGNTEIGNTIVQTSDGGYIVAGTTTSEDGHVSSYHGFWDFWVVKLDSSGNIIWEETYGGSAFDYARSIIQTSDGGYVVVGETESNDGDITENKGGKDMWVIKLNPDGVIEWQKTYGGSNSDAAWSVTQISDGSYMIAGNSASNDGDVSGHHGNAGWFDFWLLKINSEGNIQWDKSLGGTQSDDAMSVKQTADGGYIVAGRTYSNDGDVTGFHGAPGGFSDMWVVKTDAEGNMQWQKCLGGSNDDDAHDIIMTNEGGYLVVGRTKSNNGDVSNNYGFWDVWVVNLDGEGNMLWEKNYGGSSGEEALSIDKTTDNGYVIAGYSNSNDGDVSGNNGNSDFWVFKINSSAEIIWRKSMGGSNNDDASVVRQTSDGGFIIAGSSDSNNGDVSGNMGQADMWVVKLNSELNVQDLANSSLRIYPNPASNILNIQHDLMIKKIMVIDFTGKAVINKHINSNKSTIDISAIPSGIYLVQIYTNDTPEVVKIIKK